MKIRRALILLLSLASSALAQTPSIQLRPNQSEYILEVVAPPDQSLVLEASDTLEPSSWTPRIAGQVLDGKWEWREPTLKPAGFFRLRSSNELLSTVDFRLTDQLGVSHDLAYQEEQAAVVLFFVDNDMLANRALMKNANALRAEFAPKRVVFWLINANPEQDRESVAQAAASGGAEMPVLQDIAPLLAMDLRVGRNGTAVGLNPITKEQFYHGPALAGGTFRRALENFLASKPIGVRFLAHNGPPISKPKLGPQTYTNDIANILAKNCVSCHRAGSIGPMEFKDYDSVKKEAEDIRDEVLGQRMPPWHADPVHGKFQNDARLSLEDAARLISWTEQGAPRGEGDDPLVKLLADSASQESYPKTWPAELGQPDYIFSIPEQTIPAEGDVDYVYETVMPNLPEGAWIKAAIVLPGNAAVVHHCLVFDGTLLQFLGGLNGFFAGYVPGAQPVAFPEGTGKFLAKGKPLTFQMHYTTTGKVEKDRTRLGLYVHKQKPTRELKTEAAFNVFDINIPPNALDYQVTASKTFSKDVFLYELNPHMHYRGSRFRYEAAYPDGTREVLLNVPKYYFDWQTAYRFAEPKRLPAGTRLICTGAYDNSKFNHENPNPNARVKFGDQSHDEMFVGYVNYAETGS